MIDLDNTIYPEIAFLNEAYHNVALSIEKMHNISSSEIYSYLVKEFEIAGRSNIFDKLLSKFSIDPSFLNFLLSIMRNTVVSDKIQIFPEAKMILDFALNENKKVFVVTNGNIHQQKNKVDSIAWEGLDEKLFFVYANMYEPKPSIASCSYILSNLDVQSSKGIMIGDSLIDRQFAINLGVDFYLARWYKYYSFK
jgi:phosphoglycolate phosphatase-like HAD superfamily hydrolase